MPFAIHDIRFSDDGGAVVSFLVQIPRSASVNEVSATVEPDTGPHPAEHVSRRAQDFLRHRLAECGDYLDEQATNNAGLPPTSS